MAMNPGMKMMMLQRTSQERNRNQSEYGGGRRMIGYDRGANGQANSYENYSPGGTSSYGGAYNPESNGGYNNRYMQENGGHSTEARRRRDSRGRYMMGGMEYDDDDDDMRSQTWYPPHGGMPPMGMSPGNSYGDIFAHGSIYAPGAMNKPMGGMMGGGGDMSQPVDEHTARMWVGKMDGGEKFKIEQTEQQRMAICPDCEKWEFYTAMNAMHSDHCESAKKLGVDRPDYYAHLAKDFLKDKDAKPGKLRRYMEHIAK